MIAMCCCSISYCIDHTACTTNGGSTSCSSGTVAGLVFFEVFSYLWTSQVIGNVALATLAGGAYGGWYYFGPREQGLMPKHPTLSALGRASTLSLGSIAFGSLIVTLLELLRHIDRPGHRRHEVRDSKHALARGLE